MMSLVKHPDLAEVMWLLRSCDWVIFIKLILKFYFIQIKANTFLFLFSSLPPPLLLPLFWVLVYLMVGLYSNNGCCELLFTETFEMQVYPIDLCPLTEWLADIFSLHLAGNIWIFMNNVYIKWFSSGSWRLSADLKLILDLSELSISAGGSAGLTYVLHSSDLGWCSLQVLTCLLTWLLTVANSSETERKWCQFSTFISSDLHFHMIYWG